MRMVERFLMAVEAAWTRDSNEDLSTCRYEEELKEVDGHRSSGCMAVMLSCCSISIAKRAQSKHSGLPPSLLLDSADQTLMDVSASGSKPTVEASVCKGDVIGELVLVVVVDDFTLLKIGTFDRSW